MSAVKDEVTALSWSPDGKHIASASKDQTVQVWQVRTGKQLLTYRGHGAEVTAISRCECDYSMA